MKLPPTLGTTALLGIWSIVVNAIVSTGLLWVVVSLATGEPETAETRIEALRTMVLVGPAVLGALTTVETAVIGFHGGRHLGGAPAPTTGEIRQVQATTDALAASRVGR